MRLTRMNWISQSMVRYGSSVEKALDFHGISWRNGFLFIETSIEVMNLKLPDEVETFLETLWLLPQKYSTLAFPARKVSSKAKRLIELALSILEDATRANADW